MYQTYFCHDCCQFNAALADRILQLENSEVATRTHYFAGRYENVYIPAEQLDQVNFILDIARQQSARILKLDLENLAIGFWFNIMRQGDVTLPHTHDDDDELLSGTYYLRVPDTTSQLVLDVNGKQESVTPREGMFVFFPPDMRHEVTKNNASEPRISIGFNLGLKRD